MKHYKTKRFLKKNARFTGALIKEVIGGAVILGIIGGIAIDILKTPYLYEYVEASEPIEVIDERKEVRIEIINKKVEEVPAEIIWTAELIAQEIDRVFPDAPIMHDVMRCESGGKIDAYNPTNNSHDNGLLQISDLYHGERVRALGLDVGDPADNIAFGRILYDERGLQPWSASKHCWNQ